MATPQFPIVVLSEGCANKLQAQALGTADAVMRVPSHAASRLFPHMQSTCAWVNSINSRVKSGCIRYQTTGRTAATPADAPPFHSFLIKKVVYLSLHALAWSWRGWSFPSFLPPGIQFAIVADPRSSRITDPQSMGFSHSNSSQG